MIFRKFYELSKLFEMKEKQCQVHLKVRLKNTKKQAPPQFQPSENHYKIKTKLNLNSYHCTAFADFSTFQRFSNSFKSAGTAFLYSLAQLLRSLYHWEDLFITKKSNPPLERLSVWRRICVRWCLLSRPGINVIHGIRQYWIWSNIRLHSFIIWYCCCETFTMTIGPHPIHNPDP